MAELFVALADSDFREYSPVYDRLARAIARDDSLIEFVARHARTDARRGRVPVLFLAAIHDVVLADPGSPLAAIYRGESAADPWPEFRALVDREADVIAAHLATRSVQTNEVGRSAVLAPALSGVARTGDPPVALVEIGPSAGLNLFPDRYAIEYVRDGAVLARAGDDASPVRLSTEVVGPCSIPVPVELPTIAVRTGIDPAPVDVTDPRQRRWLQACVWPGVPDRPALLAAALDLVAQDPPALVRGDAVTDLGPVLAGLPGSGEVLPVVVATWALAYVSSAGRAELLAAVDAIGATRDLALVTFEEPRATPWVPALADGSASAAGGTSTVLGVREWRAGRCRTRALAHAQPHGRRIAWADDRES
ncbi:MAG: DUF2332 domain-containing protein [Actinomycetes bacterium]